MTITRRMAREIILGLIFETDYHSEDGADMIYENALRSREIDEDEYIRSAFFGIMENLPALDALIGEHSRGWKTYRISGVSRGVMRLCTWEMLYMNSIPHNVSINEAIELVKKYDDPKARAFVNGVLNAIKNGINNHTVNDPSENRTAEITEPETSSDVTATADNQKKQ